MLALPPAEDMLASGQVSVAHELVTIAMFDVAVFDDAHNKVAKTDTTNPIRLAKFDIIFSFQLFSMSEAP
jgi:hypothetical protein